MLRPALPVVLTPKEGPECQFCRSTDWDPENATCRNCGTAMPSNAPTRTYHRYTGKEKGKSKVDTGGTPRC